MGYLSFLGPRALHVSPLSIVLAAVLAPWAVYAITCYTNTLATLNSPNQQSTDSAGTQFSWCGYVFVELKSGSSTQTGWYTAGSTATTLQGCYNQVGGVVAAQVAPQAAIGNVLTFNVPHCCAADLCNSPAARISPPVGLVLSILLASTLGYLVL